jgi:hypothetical protein
MYRLEHNEAYFGSVAMGIDYPTRAMRRFVLASRAFITRTWTEQISCSSTGSKDDRGDLLEIVIHRNPFL